MGNEVTDLEYVEDLIADLDLRPSDKIADLIEALENEESERKKTTARTKTTKKRIEN